MSEEIVDFIPDEPINIWDKLPDEPAEAYARFCVFRDLGKNRTLFAAYEKFEAKVSDIRKELYPNSRSLSRGKQAKHRDTYISKRLKWEAHAEVVRATWGDWREWAVRYNWWQRAAAWDREQERRENLIWEQARQELREREWNIAKNLLDRAVEMLKWPLAEEKDTQHDVVEVQVVDENGEPTGETVKAKIPVKRVVKPMKWGADSIAKLAEAGSRIARLALELNTQHVLIENWRDEARMHGINPEEFVTKLAGEFLNAMIQRNLLPEPNQITDIQVDQRTDATDIITDATDIPVDQMTDAGLD